MLVACQAKRVLEAQFQDAVREEIDNLYTEFVDVLAARETVREAREAVAELEDLPTSPRARKTPEEDQRLEVQRESAEIALTEAEEQYKSDLRALGTLLKMTPAESERLQVRGSLHELTPSPPLGRPLLELALASRPTWPPTGWASAAPKPTSTSRWPTASRTCTCSTSPTRSRTTSSSSPAPRTPPRGASAWACRCRSSTGTRATSAAPG